MSANLPVILIELVLVFGGTLAFGWWQLRSVKRDRERSRAQAEAQAQTPSLAPSKAAMPAPTQADRRPGPAVDEQPPRP